MGTDSYSVNLHSMVRSFWATGDLSMPGHRVLRMPDSHAGQ